MDVVGAAVFLGATLVIMLTPGPDMLYVLARTVSQGRAAGLIAVLGVASGILVHTTLAAFGISRLLLAYPAALLALRIAGALYLVFLAIMAWRAGARPLAERFGPPAHPLVVWRDAFVTNLLNPKALVFFVAFLPQFAVTGANAFGQLMGLGLLVVACSVVVNGTLAVLVAPASGRLLRNETVSKSQRWITSGVLALLAVRIVV